MRLVAAALVLRLVARVHRRRSPLPILRPSSITVGRLRDILESSFERVELQTVGTMAIFAATES